MRTGNDDTVPRRATPRPTGLPGRQRTTLSPVPADDFSLLCNDVRGRATLAVEALIADIRQRLPPMPLHQALGIIYLHYWAEDDSGEHSEFFKATIADMKKVYCARHALRYIQTSGLLDGAQLDEQARKFEDKARMSAPKAMNTGAQTLRRQRGFSTCLAHSLTSVMLFDNSSNLHR